MTVLDTYLDKDLPNPVKITCTKKVIDTLTGQQFVKLPTLIWEEYQKQPDEDLKGGNDKRFFTIELEDKGIYKYKLWVVANEVGGVTVMFPEEY